MCTQAKSIGLIAGNGCFPRLFAQAARERGVRVVAVGLRGETDTQLQAEVDSFTWVTVGRLQKIINIFKQHGITQAAMAGGVNKQRLFRQIGVDWLTLRLLATCWLRRDDALLRAVAACFERHGIRIVASTCFLPDLLAPMGLLTTHQPTPAIWRDLQFGLNMAKEIGKLDIGQTVVVRQGSVVALEGIEGTDACIMRAGALTHFTGSVVVKAAKPQQDMRFDVPAIGPHTMHSLVAAGAVALGVEANKTLILQPQRTLHLAQAFGLRLVGMVA